MVVVGVYVYANNGILYLLLLGTAYKVGLADSASSIVRISDLFFHKNTTKPNGYSSSESSLRSIHLCHINTIWNHLPLDSLPTSYQV